MSSESIGLLGPARARVKFFPNPAGAFTRELLGREVKSVSRGRVTSPPARSDAITLAGDGNRPSTAKGTHSGLNRIKLAPSLSGSPYLGIFNRG